MNKRFENLWERLDGKRPHMPHFLDEIYLSGLRGIKDLRVKFSYPVSVIAGGNASGKSTVLFAAACAYKVPGAGVKDFVPSTLFPDYRPKHRGRTDARQPIVIEFEYSTPVGRRAMRWRRAKGWSRSFFGRKGAVQPERPVYLRTLTNLSTPSEVRGVLRKSHLKAPPDETALTASQINFAQQILPFRYSEVTRLSSKKKACCLPSKRRAHPIPRCIWRPGNAPFCGYPRIYRNSKTRLFSLTKWKRACIRGFSKYLCCNCSSWRSVTTSRSSLRRTVP